MPAGEADPLEEQPSIPRRSRAKPRTPRYLLMFVTSVLVANALVGERSLAAILRANQQSRDLASSIAELQRENAALREQARQLREDPRAIEHLARREIGLIRPGERLFIETGPPILSPSRSAPDNNGQQWTTASPTLGASP